MHRAIPFALALGLVAGAASLASASPVTLDPHEVGNFMFWSGEARQIAYPHPPHPVSKWVELYNEKDLSGWKAKDGQLSAWKANGDMISCVGGGGGWLTTVREYGDFELHLEYRIGPGGNSGVGIRYPAQGDPAHVGMEIQVLDDYAPEYKNLKAAQYNGGIYYQSPPMTKAAKKTGEWNTYDIRCAGPHIQVRLNGVLIQDINVEHFMTGEGGYTPLAKRPRKGFIGMQSHGHQVDFRNLRIREIP